MTEFVPKPHQGPAIEFVLATPRCMLAIDMGLGKTSITLTAIDQLLRTGEVRRALVVAPKRVARSTWPDEIRKWAHTRGIDFAVAIGDPRERERAVAQGASVTIINRENVDWLVKRCRKAWPYDTLVIDESSDVKDPGTRRFRALRSAVPACRRVILLTGTPIGNSYLDIWSQIYLLDGGQRLGRTFTGFRNEHFTPGYNGWKWTLRQGSDQTIRDAISDIVYVLRAEDWLHLPAIVRQVEPVVLSDDVRVAYKRMEKKAVLELASGEEITALSAAKMTDKLLQITAGIVYTEDQGSYAVIGHDKLTALEELLGILGEPAVVAYRYRADAEIIMRRFRHAMEVRQPRAIELWNAGKLPILLLHPQSGGFGLNLQDGGRHMVWYGLTWSMIHHQQTLARLHRQGQTRPVHSHYLIGQDTIDERVLAMLDGKHASLVEMLNSLKRTEGSA